MAQAGRTFAGLDIGTTKISCIIADQNAAGGLRVVGLGNAPGNCQNLFSRVLTQGSFTQPFVRKSYRQKSSLIMNLPCGR